MVDKRTMQNSIKEPLIQSARAICKGVWRRIPAPNSFADEICEAMCCGRDKDMKLLEQYLYRERGLKLTIKKAGHQIKRAA